MKLKINILSIFIALVLFNGINGSYAYELNLIRNNDQPNVVFIDDDFNISTPGWGYDHFDNIQDGIDNVTNNGEVNIYFGSYKVFKIESRSNILIKSNDTDMPIVSGNQTTLDESINPPMVTKCVIIVNNSPNIELNKLNVSGDGLNGRSYAIFYNGSSGKINNCIISPNQRGNMNSLGIRAQCYSIVSIENSTIHNYGRIGIYCKTGTVLNVYNNEIIGQVYTPSDGDYVSYGIEVEDLVSASNATIRFNGIYNHDYIGNPSWSSAGIIIDSWRYYEVTPDKCSAIVEYNNIYDNMLGLQIIPNENIHVNLNMIYNNDFGAVSDPYLNGTVHVYENLDAINNWWGNETGPYNPNSNPNATGNEVTDYVIYNPWIENYLPKIKIINPKPYHLYFNLKDLLVFKIPFITTLVIGKNDIDVEATSGIYEIEKIEFYVNEKLKSTDNIEPYNWTWDERTILSRFTLKVVVYDIKGYQTIDEMKIWKRQFILC